MKYLFALSLMTIPTLAPAADWPHWLGPNSTGSSPETGLATAWPAAGPKILWKVPGGDGYSSIAVVGNQAFTLVQRDKQELAIALDVSNGKELWKTPIGPAFKNQYGNGPRSTPWVEGDAVFAQSVNGPLVCLDRKTGAIIWTRDLLKEFDAKNISWGLSASPVVADKMVLGIPGGKLAGVAAFDPIKGATLWKTGNDKAAYASPVIVEVGGKKQAIFFNAAGLLGVALDTGKELWRMPWVTEFDCNIATPLRVAPDKIFVSSGEGVGCALLHLQATGEPKIVWESKGAKSSMINCWSNPVVHEGHLYGLAGEFDKRIHLRCLDLNTGAVKWTKQEFGKGAMTLADGHLFITTKLGELVLVRAAPSGYEEKGRAQILGTNRTVPTIANRRLFIRDLENIVCVDLSN